MEKNNKIRRLLSVQEHPERYSDEQLLQLLSDKELAELMQQLALLKQAVVSHDVDREEIPVDTEWARFSATHASELTVFSHRHIPFLSIHSFFRKVAAVLVGILFLAGVSFAAIQVVRGLRMELAKPKPMAEEVPVSQQLQSAPVADVTPDSPTAILNADTLSSASSMVFDNVALDDMLEAIAAYYHVEVSFESPQSQSLRFYFVWNRADGLAQTIAKLNRFERVNVKIENDQIIVE